jgi:hypothetical protein
MMHQIIIWLWFFAVMWMANGIFAWLWVMGEHAIRAKALVITVTDFAMLPFCMILGGLAAYWVVTNEGKPEEPQ